MHYPLQHATSDTPRSEICEYHGEYDCKYLKTPGSDYCSRHGANKQIAKLGQATLYNFKLDRVRARTNLLATDSARYKLEEELAILRLTLEDTINKITHSEDPNDPHSLFAASDTIKNLVLSIDKLVQSSIVQSQRLKLLLTRQDLIKEVQLIIDIISEEIDDVDTIIRIGERISESLSEDYNIREATDEEFESSI